MKKKIATLILTAAMAASFAGCGKTAEPPQVAEVPAQVESSAPAEESAEPAKTEETPAPKESTTPEATTEPGTEFAVASTTTPTPVPTVEPTPVPTEEPKAAYTYTDKSGVMYAKSSVNVRNLPSTDGEKVGALNMNDVVTVTGVCNETGWYRFELNGQEAYVSGNYLQASKVQVASNAGANTNANTQGAASGTGTTVATNETTVAGNGTTAASGTAESGQGTENNTASGPSTDNMVWDGGEIKGYEQADGSVTIVDKGGNVVEENAEILDDWGLENAHPATEEDKALTQQWEDMIRDQVGIEPGTPQ